MSKSLDFHCFNSSGFRYIPLPNALSTIFLPLRSAVALLNTSSFTFFELEFCGLVLLLNSQYFLANGFVYHFPYSH